MRAISAPEVGVVAAVAPTDLPDDLRAAARSMGARRQVARFLDGMALPAFVAGLGALDAAGVRDGERCAVFTVSGWDPDPRPPDLDGEAGADSYREVARHYITTASPMSWLPKMVNNALCQISMTRGLRGPNNHVVGGPGALAAVLALGRSAIENGAADHVLVVACDAPIGQESDSAAEGMAGAVVLAAVADDGEDLSLLDEPGVIGDRGEEGARGPRSVDALEGLIAGLGQSEGGNGGC